MDNINDELQIYRGSDFYITDDIYVKQPTVNDICDFGEERYLRMVTQLTSVPQNSIYMLYKMGIDFTQISDFEMFVLIHSVFKYEETQMIIPNLNFETAQVIRTNKVTSKGTVLDTQELALLFDNSVVLNAKKYADMMTYIRKINKLQRPWFKTVGNESTKKRMIRSAITEYEQQADNKEPFKSIYVPLISSLATFGYRCDEIWNMKLYMFFDIVTRLQLKEQADHLYSGIYSGCIDAKKIGKDLNWMRTIEFKEFSDKTNISIEG